MSFWWCELFLDFKYKMAADFQLWRLSFSKPSYYLSHKLISPDLLRNHLPFQTSFLLVFSLEDVRKQWSRRFYRLLWSNFWPFTFDQKLILLLYLTLDELVVTFKAHKYKNSHMQQSVQSGDGGRADEQQLFSRLRRTRCQVSTPETFP